MGLEEPVFHLKIYTWSCHLYILQFDGLFRRLPAESDEYPGIMCFGWLICRDDTFLAQGYGGFAHWKLATSNGAEYLALIAGLEALIELKATNEPVLIQGDARTIIDQMQSRVLTHSPRVQQFRRKARKLCRDLTDIHWDWTPRRNNRNADRLTRQALDFIRLHNPSYFSPDITRHFPPDSRKGLQPIYHESTLPSNGRLSFTLN